MGSLNAVVEAISARARTRTPVIVGIAGPVAAGKTTVATAIADELATGGSLVRVLTTDSFLFPNAELAARDLVMRKGFPETYDDDAIAHVLGRLRRGEPATAPVYSHVTYDIVPGQVLNVEPSDVVLIEGVIALQPSVRRHLDLAIYVDADEEFVREWFVERFVRLTEASRNDETSFYHRFAALPREQLRRLAEGTWDGINGPNLHEHIAPTKAHADLVVSKDADHTVTRVETRGL